MKLESVLIRNFRLLKDLKLDLEKDLSLVLGKNNSGKTSILSVLDKFINQSENKKISADDFNLSYKEEIKNLIESPDELSEEDFNKDIKGITIRLIVSYSDEDDFENISKLMMDLDPDNNYLVLGYDYSIHFNEYQLFRQDFKVFKIEEQKKINESLIREKDKPQKERKLYREKGFDAFFKLYHDKYFFYKKKSIAVDHINGIILEDQFIDLDNSSTKVNLKNVINFKYISASRSVTNKEADKTLSSQTSQIYERSEKNEEDTKSIEEFKETLIETDETLTNVYTSLFEKIVGKVERFGGIKKGESVIKVISSLERKELLKGNTTVIYEHDSSNSLPEFYNGLGYMNLISMIFEIEILLQEFKRNKDEKPADINLLFIEEPEAHTHPQMQYVFITNIQSLLEEGIIKGGCAKKKLQYIISTHSSHIVSNCKDFNSIKYLKKESLNSIMAKNLRDLESEYTIAGEEQNYKFLKQYLTLNRSELFFADKAIFIEGDTERILVPAMMRKIDLEEELVGNELELLSQNISIVEVGAHSFIFEKFIDFIGVKSVIITDIDSYYQNSDLDDKGEKQYHKNGSEKLLTFKCPSSHDKAALTNNNSLAFFHKGNRDLNYYKSLKNDWKILRKNRNKQWNSNRKGKLLVAFQTEQLSYHARSFEDAFFHINYDFICEEKDVEDKKGSLKKEFKFGSLTKKWLKDFKKDKDSFKLAEYGVDSKPAFAIEILLNSQSDGEKEFINWQIPDYIKEALIWLRKE
ncbi:ATP-dependent nuclease [Flavobacterium sp. T12S277]|uniref:ATP-dependent nuclease n=1 Tax=Flavobacterium sp. T12S277 TaxID=3402752 RepID=UPI003AEE3332